MTRAEIEARIRLALDDPDQTLWGRGDRLHQALTEALEVLAEEAPVRRRTYTLPRREGQMLYRLGSVGPRIQTPYRLWLPDVHRRLTPLELTELDARHEQWMTVSGPPFHWFPVDGETFGIWPWPAQAGGWLQVDCFVWPQPMVDDDDSPDDLPLDAHEALVFYGESEGYLRQGDVARALDLWQAWLTRWGSARSQAEVGRLVSRLWGRSMQTSSRREDV